MYRSEICKYATGHGCDFDSELEELVQTRPELYPQAMHCRMLLALYPYCTQKSLSVSG